MSLTESLQLSVLVAMIALFLCSHVILLEELGQNGNDIILFYYILLQIVGCSIIKNFAQFVGFVISPSELVMLLSCCILFL